MNRGYVRLWRCFLDDGYLQNANRCVFMLWCLLKATHQPHTVAVGMQQIHLSPGEFIFTLRNASRDLKLSVKQIRVIAATLKNSGFLALKTTNKFSVITIVNWPIYQAAEEEKGTQKGTLRAHKGHIYKNGKNEKKNNAPASGSKTRRTSGSRLLDRHYEGEGWTIVPAGTEQPRSTGSRLYDRVAVGRQDERTGSHERP